MKKKHYYILGLVVFLILFYLLYWKKKLATYAAFKREVTNLKNYIRDGSAEWREVIEQEAQENGVSFEQQLDTHAKWKKRSDMGLSHNPTLFY